MRKPGIVAALSAVVVALYLLVAGTATRAPEGPAIAPPLAGPLSGGGKAALSDYAGKVVLVDFWATWCDPCLIEIPDLIALQRKHAPKGLVVLGVSMDNDGEEAVGPLRTKLGIDYPVILNGSEQAPAGWSTPGFPTAYLVGRNGMIVRRWLGSKDMDEVERDVQAALAAP